jgi:hypothetical protein
MSRRARAFAFLLVAIVAVCPVLFADGIARAETCGLAQVLAPAKPGPERPPAPPADAPAVPTEFVPPPPACGASWLSIPARSDVPAGDIRAEPPAPRAPPLV